MRSCWNWQTGYPETVVGRSPVEVQVLSCALERKVTMEIYEVRQQIGEPAEGEKIPMTPISHFVDEESAVDYARTHKIPGLFVYLLNYSPVVDTQMLDLQETHVWDAVEGYTDGRDKPSQEELDRREYERLKALFEGS